MKYHIAIIAILVIIAGAGTATYLHNHSQPADAQALRRVVIFGNGFEDGLASWTSADNGWSAVKTNNAAGTHSGLYRAETKIVKKSDQSLTKAISTVGYSAPLAVNFSYKVPNGLLPSDHVYLEWSADGTTWNMLANHTDRPAGGWYNVSYTLPPEATNQSNFQFRFRTAELDKKNDFWLDDVSLTGFSTSGQTPTTTPPGPSPE